MSDEPAATDRENPYATRWTRPGSIPYQFPPDDSMDSLLERLRLHRWRGAIVGGHGTGKSTLLASLVGPLSQRGFQPVLVSLHDGQRRLPEGLFARLEHDARPLLIVDGYEQLGIWPRLRLGRFRRRGPCGLIVTCHRPCGLPVVFRTRVDARLAERIIARLDPAMSLAQPPDIANLLAAHGTNMRELLFELYDRYEEDRRRRQS